MKTKSKIEEKKLTKAELETREKVIKDLKKNKSSLVKRYGKDAEAVMYGRATNIAKKMAESENKNKIKELVRKALMQEMDAEAGADKYEGEQKLSQASAMLSALESKLKSHNWFHYQTDGRVYDEGMAQKKEIQDIVKNLQDMGYGNGAKELYNKYAPYEEGGVNLRLKEEDMGLEEDEDLTLTFRDKNEFQKAKEHFESNSEFYPEYISDEFKSFHFKVQDQADADSTEYYLTQELEGTTDLNGYFFALEPSMMNEKKKTFPDMTGDGKVTRADILKARGVDLKKSKGEIDESGYREMTPSERANKQRMDNQLKNLSNLKKSQEDKERLLKLQQKIHKDRTKSLMKEEELEEAYVPSNIKEFAKRKGATSLVNKVAGWAEKAGKGIRGGTAIGKNYSTLVLDLGYQDGAIRINLDDDIVELYGEEVFDAKSFRQVYLDNQEATVEVKEETYSVGPMIKSKEFKAGDKVKYKGMNHEITRIVDDRIYIKNLKYSGRPDTWVKAIDLKKSVKEDIDLGHEDNEPHMIKGDLYRIGKYAMELYQMVDEFEGKGEVDFPHWWQSKIINAKSNLVGAKHYLDFEVKEPAIDAMVGVASDEEILDDEPMMEAEIGKADILSGELYKLKGKIQDAYFAKIRKFINMGSYEDAEYLLNRVKGQMKEKSLSKVNEIKEDNISKDEILAGKIMKALKDMANKDASDQHNLKQARIALNKGNMDAAKKIAKPYIDGVNEATRTYWHVIEDVDGEKGHQGVYNTKEEAEKQANRLSDMFSRSFFYVEASNNRKEPVDITLQESKSVAKKIAKPYIAEKLAKKLKSK